MCADVSYHTDRVLFWERRAGSGGREGSFLVKSKCMARGLLKKKKKKPKKNLSRTFAMAAHIPQSHGDEITVEKKKKNGRVLPSSLQCHFSFNPCFVLFSASRFTSDFYFETGNTKLPETAQFTQAPQSTTAFKLS